MNAPICLFVYNRCSHTKKTIESLKKNRIAATTEIFIFSDAAKTKAHEKDVAAVRKYIQSVSGFKKINIILADNNKGLANSIIDGVSYVMKKNESVIVFEDDLITSPVTLEYLNIMLDTYKDNNQIMSITSYNYPESTIPTPNNYSYSNYFTGRPCSWGWATWRDRWESIVWKGNIYDDYLNNKAQQHKFKKYAGTDIHRMLKKQLKNKIDSWAVRFVFNCFIQNKLASYPTKSYITNIGSDGSGTHKGLNNDKIANTTLNSSLSLNSCPNYEINVDYFNSFNSFVKKKYILKRLSFIIKGFFIK
ncbi:glycosyltransferase [Providencia manganoxydans]|uniref:glycosyltransferase n=1 Tax=Providencia manganoxydans TaxID=2923283 RepID=UPI0034E37C90